tara:strand:- start:60 stop:1037 length:978 start_codon:yes stop_codon:yes gene_type:complete
MLEPVIKQGWLRALMFIPIWFLCTTVLGIIGGGIVFSIAVASGAVIWGDQASIEEWAMNMGNDFTSPTMLILTTASIVGSFAAIWFMMTVINKEPLTNIGLSIKDRGKDMLVGLGVALLFIGGIFLILWALGAITVTGVVEFKPAVFLVGLTLFIAAFNEEIVFRGYVLNNLMDSMNRWWALGISSFLFALLHLGNPGILSNWVPLTELFAAGFILGISYTFTKNLWFPTFFHVGWNFFQGLLGFEISGINIDSWKIIDHKIALTEKLDENGDVIFRSEGVPEMVNKFPDLISGGVFGIEGSVISLTLTILGTYAIYRYYIHGQQ